VKQLIFSAVLCSAYFSSFAQSKETIAYRKESEDMRKSVWAWENAKFKVRDIPQKYANASKIIIAHHTELTADSKSTVAFYGLGFGTKHKQNLTEIVREIVKLNDKNAVTEYSELSFTQFEKRSGFYTSDKTSTYLGVRVIKADGTVKEINADEVVLTKDAANEKQAKLAIPDLQPGDILDYFFATAQNTTNDFATKVYTLLLFDNAPVLSYSFHSQLGKKFAIEYRSYNGAPEITINKSAESDIVIDVQKNDMPPFETNLWVSATRQLPFIRMNISQGYKGMGSAAMGMSKPGEIKKIVNSQNALEEKSREFSMQYYNGYWIRANKTEYTSMEGLAKVYAKQMGVDYKTMSRDEKAALLFYTARFYWFMRFHIDDLESKMNLGSKRFDGFPFSMFALLKAADLDPAIMIYEDRTGFRMNEAMNGSDLGAVAYLPGTNKYFSMTSVFDVPFTTPASAEGAKSTKSFTFDHPAMVGPAKIGNLTEVAPGPNVTTSKSADNARIEKLQISFTAGQTSLSVKRNTTLKGHYKLDEQTKLVVYEDIMDYESKVFKQKQLLLDEIASSKSGKKYINELRNAFAEARKKQKDAFLKEAKDWFEQEVTELQDYRIDNPGIRHTAPDFVYSSNFQLGGLVKKAGNNIIVEIGKIQGTPLVIKEEQKKRALDVYMPFARSIEYHLEIAIPEGYTAEGVAALNSKVQNETGYFITEANSNGQTVSIKIMKHYLSSYEPLQNFEKILAFVNASSEWTNAKLLLKKK
jgi:hypothetical protein